MKSFSLALPLILLSGCSQWDDTRYPHNTQNDLALVQQVEYLALEIQILANRGARTCLPGQLQTLERIYMKAEQEASSGFEKDAQVTLVDAQEQVHLITHQLDWLEEHTQCLVRSTEAQERRQLMMYFAIDNQFATDRTQLLPDYEKALQHAAAILARHPDWFITLTGYTDARATTVYNQELGLNRALRVKDFLITQGVDPNQLAARSGGEQFAAPTTNTTQMLAERTVIAELTKMRESSVPDPSIHAIRHWHIHP
uniref:OmpA family protein n=1 Tax=Thaumasiovibrio occultus TaxID=1891184 RepID=UPI000B350CA0|nr:OmpA family protein [Thaumasiovibrio occultus]